LLFCVGFGSAAEDFINCFAYCGANDHANQSFYQPIDPYDGGDNTKNGIAKGLDKIGVSKKEEEKCHKEEGIQKSTGERGCTVRNKFGRGFIKAIESLENQSTEPTHQKPCDKTHDKGEDGIDGEKHGAKLAHSETLDEACKTKNSPKKCACRRTDDNGTDDDGNGDEGDLNNGRLEVADRRKGHHDDNRRQQRKLHKVAGGEQRGFAV